MHFLIATVEHLAGYLLYFDKNKTAYNTYFKWNGIKFIDNGPLKG